MTNTPDTSPEAVERLAESYVIPGMPEDCRPVIVATTLRALSAERDRLRSALEKAVLACGNQARARGEAEGKLAASEMAGVVDGWKARAEASEAERDALKAKLIEAADALKMVGAIIHNGDDPDGSCFFDITAAQIDQIFTFLARHQKEADT